MFDTSAGAHTLLNLLLPSWIGAVQPLSHQPTPWIPMMPPPAPRFAGNSLYPLMTQNTDHLDIDKRDLNAEGSL